MSTFAPFTEVQLQMMAMSKARGYSWQMMATCLEMPLDVVERVAWTHGKVWNRMLTKAERLVARETVAEAVGMLRRDIAEAEPHWRPTIVNSLTRLLKQQQEYAPRKRPRMTPGVPPVAAPVMTPCAGPPAPETPPSDNVAKPPTDIQQTDPLASLRGTVASLLALFMLVGALLMGWWNSAPRVSERPTTVACEPVALLALPCRLDNREEPPSAPRVALTPPPWGRERLERCRDGT